MKLEEEIKILRSQKYGGKDTKEFRKDVVSICNGENLYFLLGFKKFEDIKVYLNGSTMVPRDETYEWIKKEALEIAKDKKYKFLDMCCGSGMAGIYLAKNFSGSDVAFSDINDGSFDDIKRGLEEISHNNAELNKDIKYTFIKSDVFEEFADNLKFDYIFAVPPYVDINNFDEVNVELENAPTNSFFDVDGGLDVAKRIISGARERLENGGVLYIELDTHQVPKMIDFAVNFGFEAREIIDIYGNKCGLKLKKHYK